MTSRDEREVGSLAEEAARLAEALQDRAQGSGAIADGSAACRVCPLCQLIAMVRQLNPETVDRIGDQVQGLTDSLRTLVDSLAGDRPDHRDPGVHKIRLSDDEEGEV